MHLFILLIAAVFSSQFVEPNLAALVSIDPATVSTEQFAGTLPAFTITTTDLTGATVVWKLSLTPDPSADADTISPTSTDKKEWALSAFQLDNVTNKGIPAKFYLVLKVNDTAEESLPITVTPVFSVAPNEIFEHETLSDVALTLTGPATWVNTTTVAYAISPTAPVLADDIDEAEIKENAKVPSATQTVAAKIPADKAADLVEDLEDGKAYIYAGLVTYEAAGANAPVPVTIKLAPFKHDKTTPTLFSVASAAAFDITLTERASTKLWLQHLNVSIRVSTDLTGATNFKDYTFNVTLAAGGVATLSIATADWKTIGVTSAAAARVYVWAGLSAATILTTIPNAFTILPDFVVNKESIDSDATTFTGLEITTNSADWTKIKVKFSLEKLVLPAAAAFGETAEISSVNKVFTLAAPVTIVGNLKPEGFLWVYVGLVDSVNLTQFNYALEPIAIPVVNKFTVTATALKDSAEAIANIVITPKAAPTIEGATKVITLYFSLEATDTPSELPTTGDALWDGTEKTATLATLAIPELGRLASDKPVFVYASYQYKPSGGAEETRWLADSGSIAVIEDDDAVRFKLSIEEIVAEDIATTDGITVTHTIGKAWTGPVKASLQLTGAAAAHVTDALQATGFTYALPFDATLKTYLQGAVATNTITVKIDPASPSTYLTKPAVITVTAPAVTTFDLDIEEIAQEDMGAIAIEVTPKPAAAFATGTIKIGFTTNDTQVTADPAAILTVSKGADDKWKATGDITALVVTKDTTKVYAWIKIGDDWLTHNVELTFTPTPAAKFTITPAKVTEGKLAKADSPEFTIGIVSPNPNPPIATKSKVVFTAGAKTLSVEFAPTGTTPTHTYVIAAEACDFSSLTVTTFPTVGKVAFYPDKDGEAFGPAIPFTFEAKEEPKPEAAMGVSPLVSLLAALVFLFVKLF